MPAAWLDLLLLILAANGVPVLLARCLGSTFAYPIDGARNFYDQRPILGRSKTWRGLISAIVACGLLAPLLGYSAAVGAMAGLTSMLGDLISSFIKRRLKLAPSARALLLDQLPEALLPALILYNTFIMHWLEIVYLAVSFFILEQFLSIIFYHLGVRKQPY